MMIQWDGHITGKPNYVRGAISSGSPSTLYIDLKDQKAISGGVHIVNSPTGQKSLEKQEQRLPCLHPPMLKKKTLLWCMYFKYQKLFKCFNIMIYYILDPCFITDFHFWDYFVFKEEIRLRKGEVNRINVQLKPWRMNFSGKERRKKKGHTYLVDKMNENEFTWETLHWPIQLKKSGGHIESWIWVSEVQSYVSLGKSNLIFFKSNLILNTGLG